MLAADNRLRDTEAFRRTVRTGRRVGSPILVVHLGAPADVGPVRVGLVVSRAVGNAVVRNRVKRRLRHLLREQIEAVPAGSDVVVRALPPTAELSSSELRTELSRCLDRALRERRRAKADA